MRAIKLAAFVLILSGTSAVANEWWHDSFVWEGGTSCEGNDTRRTFTTTEMNGWENFCKISKQQKIKGIDAVIIDMTCGGNDMDPEQTKTRELLVRTDNKITIFPEGKVYQRCSSLKPAENECPFEDRLYQSDVQSPGVYQSLQFKGGIYDGEALLTGYKNDTVVWTAAVHSTCSNGTPICSLSVKTMNSGEVSERYRPLQMDNKQHWIVLPALREQIYITERYSTMHGKAYGGMVAEFKDDFKPGEDELILPQNVYKFSGCNAEN